MAELIPNPGSPEAIEKGCRCPQVDNNHGKGSGILDKNGNPTFWQNLDCPIHGGKKDDS